MKPGDTSLQFVSLLDPLRLRNKLEHYSLSNEKIGEIRYKVRDR